KPNKSPTRKRIPKRKPDLSRFWQAFDACPITRRSSFVAAKWHLHGVDAATVTDLHDEQDRMSQLCGRKDTAASLTSRDKWPCSGIVKGFEDNARQSALAFAAQRLSGAGREFRLEWICRR